MAAMGKSSVAIVAREVVSDWPVMIAIVLKREVYIRIQIVLQYEMYYF